jgi:hypothetical protein
MTIRQQLRSQLFKARGVAFACWFVLAGVILFSPSDRWRALAVIPFAGFFGSVVYMIFFIKCPKCRAQLGQTMNSMRKANFCPGCGVSFDEEP